MCAYILFWVSLAVILYVCAGYPALVTVLACLKRKPVKKSDIEPHVSIVIAALNEEKVIRGKIENCLELDYPREKLEVIIGSDGSVDGTNDLVSEYSGRGVVLHAYPARRGKISVLNDSIPKAKGEIVLLSDATEKFSRDAVRKLVRSFADESVGAVGGCVGYRNVSGAAIGDGMSAYWKYETFIMRQEALVSSAVGCDGTMYGIRKKLFVPQPADTILDDDAIPLSIALQGYRVACEPAAKAEGETLSSNQDEMKQKTRTNAGQYQLIARLGSFAFGLRGMFSFQFFSHRTLRLTVPFLLPVLFVSNIFLQGRLCAGFLVLQALFYASALAAFLLQRWGISAGKLGVPLFFCVANIASLRGFLRFLGGRQKVTWDKVSR